MEAKRVSLGEHSYSHATVSAFPGDERTRVVIGRYSSIAAGVVFVLGGEHRADWVSTSPIRCQLHLPGALEDGLPCSRGDIYIGNDCWVGHGAILLSGAYLADGAVVGAGAVVRGYVRPYSVVVGNPAREVRRRFTDEQVESLLAIRWWDWDDATVSAAVGLLCSDSIEAFIEGYGS